MTVGLGMLHRRASTTDFAAPSRYQPVGVVVGLIGVMLAVVGLIANIVAASDVGDGSTTRETLAWSFGLSTTAFAAIKIGIGTILMGITIRLWIQFEGMKAALPQLKPAVEGDAAPQYGDVRTPFGPATQTATTPPPMPIERVVPRLWAPMLALGAIAVVVGLVLSIVQSGTTNTGDFQSLSAWVQGTQFLGEGLILTGVPFLLGTILRSLRAGGGEVQESMGLVVRALKVPPSGMGYMALMGIGFVLAVSQFVLYIVAASVDEPAAWFAWLGPLREIALGIIFGGIVLALFTIGTALAAQFARVREIVTTGK